jgi:hypothetical protein
LFRGIEMAVGGIEMFTTNVLGELGAFSVTRKDKSASFAGDLILGVGRGGCKAPG